MTLAAALLAAPKLTATARDARRERSLLESLALVGFGFTSRVSLEPPDAVLLEVKGSLRLFAGAQALLQQLQAQCRVQGLAPLLALAPTPLAALALARAQLLAHKATQKSRSIPMLTDTAHFVGALAALPLTVLRWPPELLERLASLGVRSIGEVLRLPRAGFAKRFGASHRLALDRLVARAPDARTAFIPRQRFAARCEPAYELAEQASIVRACEPLLAQLEQFLRQRQCGVTTLCVWLRHRAPPAALRCEAVSTRLLVRFAAPELAAARFTSLLAERLAQTALPAPVVHLELRCGPLQPFAPGSDSLWRPGEHGGAAGREAPAFIERLRARLGNEAVYGLCLVPSHRPEAAWAVAEPQPAARALAVSSVQSTHLGRPVWLLRTPAALDITADALDVAGFTLLAGPERIETGWWDGNDVRRDYYLVRDAMGAELWLFRERSAPHRWFLQGVFA
jgi:protein ImuB